MKTMKILVVDDEAAQCMYLAKELKEEGYDVRTAGSEDEAKRVFREMKPDVVTLDIAMPSIGEKLGLKLMKHMQEERPSARIVLFSSFDFDEDVSAWNADAYVSKSADCSELKNTIKSLLA